MRLQDTVRGSPAVGDRLDARRGPGHRAAALVHEKVAHIAAGGERATVAVHLGKGARQSDHEAVPQGAWGTRAL
eukprot:7538711-Pyramimonas_sp.AAC.1